MSLSSDRMPVETPASPIASTSYLEWGAIFGGAVLAAAISSIMTAFGSAIGLTLVSPYTGKSTSLTVIAIVAALWALWISVSCFAAGGYLAGRMRRPIGDATPHERDIRDGAHGLVVWAAAALLLAAVTTSGIIGATKSAADGAASMVSTAASLTQPVDPMASSIDGLMRTTNAATQDDGSRQELTRIMSGALASGSLSAPDKSYVAAKIAARSGIPQAEAEKRVDDAMVKLNQAKEAAKQAAEKARKIGVITAFLTAAVLLVGAAAAWAAAMLGGKHRDEGMDLSHLVRRR